MKRDSLSKHQLVVRTKIVLFAAIWEQLMSKLKKKEKFLWNQNAKARFETFKIKILELPPFVVNI